MKTCETMTCMAGCRRTLAWPDGFPDRTYAICWQCRWDEHMRTAHRPGWWARRKARRSVKR